MFFIPDINIATIRYIMDGLTGLTHRIKPWRLVTDVNTAALKALRLITHQDCNLDEGRRRAEGEPIEPTRSPQPPQNLHTA